jgi:transcriptional regulator with XRE-family HTH domain
MGINLTALRGDRTKTEMCLLLGVSRNPWTSWEAGISTPSEENMKKLEELFNDQVKR